MYQKENCVEKSMTGAVIYDECNIHGRVETNSTHALFYDDIETNNSRCNNFRNLTNLIKLSLMNVLMTSLESLFFIKNIMKLMMVICLEWKTALLKLLLFQWIVQKIVKQLLKNSTFVQNLKMYIILQTLHKRNPIDLHVQIHCATIVRMKTFKTILILKQQSVLQSMVHLILNFYQQFTIQSLMAQITVWKSQ
uniref:Protein D5 n=1 Tax=Dictyostelium discoideum TaxID=44689 RepID=D5_DICDI|nr:RecName: Full=Protein D5 [Dictyostelium discoideum]CAA31638.1 unnamed protein product [Dictyostelium discoideum]